MEIKEEAEKKRKKDFEAFQKELQESDFNKETKEKSES